MVHPARLVAAHHGAAMNDAEMDASSSASAVQRPGRGRVFDSIVDAIGDTPIVRLRKLPEAHGVSATILAKLEYFNPAASVKDRIGAAMVILVFGGLAMWRMIR